LTAGVNPQMMARRQSVYPLKHRLRVRDGGVTHDGAHRFDIGALLKARLREEIAYVSGKKKRLS
jgi:hypothetical protein